MLGKTENLERISPKRRCCRTPKIGALLRLLTRCGLCEAHWNFKIWVLQRPPKFWQIEGDGASRFTFFFTDMALVTCHVERATCLVSNNMFETRWSHWKILSFCSMVLFKTHCIEFRWDEYLYPKTNKNIILKIRYRSYTCRNRQSWQKPTDMRNGIPANVLAKSSAAIRIDESDSVAYVIT